MMDDRLWSHRIPQGYCTYNGWIPGFWMKLNWWSSYKVSHVIGLLGGCMFTQAHVLAMWPLGKCSEWNLYMLLNSMANCVAINIYGNCVGYLVSLLIMWSSIFVVTVWRTYSVSAKYVNTNVTLGTSVTLNQCRLSRECPTDKLGMLTTSLVGYCCIMLLYSFLWGE